MKHQDINGHDIQPGDYVAYAALWDRSATLKYGIVVKLKERKPKWYKNTGNPPEPTVGVVSVDRTTKWEAGVCLGVTWELQAKGREVTLGFLDRMLVVDEISVPETVRRILDEHKPSR